MNTTNTNNSNEKNDNKTYVWIKLHNGIFVHGKNGGSSSPTSRSGGVTNKKRGAPSSSSSDDVWNWTPGYYSLLTTDIDDSTNSAITKEKDETLVTGQQQQYQFTLLHNPNNNFNQEEQTNDDHEQQLHVLTEENTKKLLQNGHVVLANSWEQYDFIHNLNLTNENENDGDESEYDYDQDDSSDDESIIANKNREDGFNKMNVDLINEQPDDSPPSNLIELTHLHEPSVIHALKHRYNNASEGCGGSGTMNNIYTDTGPILLAINPFKIDSSGLLYGSQTLELYRKDGERRWLNERNNNNGSSQEEEKEDENTTDGLSLPPHVYAVADRTFRTMMTRMHPLSTDTTASNNKSNNASPLLPQPLQDKSNSGPTTTTKMNQSVLVSGESGAGKTVTTKLLMAYLSKLSENPSTSTGPNNSASSSESLPSNDDVKQPQESEGIMSIEKRILESNPIMESFGNARTIRNDNSSRFGKYIEMKFVSSSSSSSSSSTTRGGKGGGEKSSNIPNATLVGASIETYLLEKVRLVHQSPGERNYHIFYELFSMYGHNNGDSNYNNDTTNNEEEMVQQQTKKLGLLEYDMEDFNLINSSGTYDRRDGISDVSTFNEMQKAMIIMGFGTSEMNSIFEVTSALLHASNLTFDRVGEVECALHSDGNPHLQYVCDLLGITQEELNSALCYYEITIGGSGRKGGETHKRVLSMEQCLKGVEALIKATFGALFNYLVKRINQSVAGDNNGGRGGGGKVARARGIEKEASIGILDIFGFESFQVNSFEQLCINYCNEALQQQFNRFVLRNEQELYDREGIPWSFIEFPENQDVLDLIDFKGSGILNMLHDQCRTPGASDKTFALAMYEKCSSHARFEADSRQVAQQLFSVHHYAGLVEYDVVGFVEKNRDELPKSGSDLLMSSTNDFVRKLAEILHQPNSSTSTSAARGGKKLMSPRSGGGATRPTVGIQFSSQLHSLRQKIDDTSPHYIRCLKPNNLLQPDHFDTALIADQLRCAGVIEAVRVSRLGYPQRFSHSQFIARYRVLGRKLKKKSKKYNPAKALVHSITQKMADQSDDVGIQVGKTKVFLRREAYDMLEKMRRDRVASAAITIQMHARGYLSRKLYDRALRSIITVQCFLRQCHARAIVTEMRQQHNSIIIQRSLRKYVARNRYLSVRVIAIWCQTHYRGHVGRQVYSGLNRVRKARYLQSRWRGYMALKKFREQITAVLVIQCARRCHLARAEFNERKGAARDFVAVVQERDRLRQELIGLRNELKTIKDERLEQPVQQPGASFAEVHSLELNERDTEIESLRAALDLLSKDKEDSDNELKEVTKTLVAVTSERDLVVQDRDDLKQVNKMLQTELNTREEELQCMKKDLAAAKKVENKASSSSGEEEAQSAAAAIISTDTSQVVQLKSDLGQLIEAHTSLQKEHEQVKNDNSALVKSMDEMKKSFSASDSRKDLYTDTSSAAVGKRTMPNDEKSPGVVVTSVCTSLTADMDMTVEEIEIARLREENQVLQKQLELLRVDNELNISDDQEYDDSVAPESNSSETFEYDDNVVPDSVMKQLADEVENCTEQVILKTRAESESKIAKLQTELADLKAEMEQNKRLAKYDIDDMTRVNRSLRGDLEAMMADKLALEEELEMKCDEFDALNEDVERFAETFAAQHEELEVAKSQARKCQMQNEKLKASLLTMESTPSKIDVGSEITKLWSEVERLRQTPPSAPAAAASSSQVNDSFARKANYQHQPLDFESSDSEDTNEKGNDGARLKSPLSLFSKGSDDRKLPANASPVTEDDVIKDLTDS